MKLGYPKKKIQSLRWAKKQQPKNMCHSKAKEKKVKH